MLDSRSRNGLHFAPYNINPSTFGTMSSALNSQWHKTIGPFTAVGGTSGINSRGYRGRDKNSSCIRVCIFSLRHIFRADERSRSNL